MVLISCLTGRKKMRANENFTEIFGSDEEQLRQIHKRRNSKNERGNRRLGMDKNKAVRHKAYSSM